MSDNMLNLSAMQLDAIREIGNVGAGNSATALSQLINKKIDMDVPSVSVVPLADVPELVGGPDTMVAGIFLRVYGKAPGSVLFLMPKESAFYLVEHLLGEPKNSDGELDEMDQSALMEIGNILAGAYLNALSYYTKLTLLPSIPAMAVDMAGAILNVVIVQLGQMGDHALVIETQFLSEDDGINGHFFLIPDSGSLQTILNAVGVK
uniref:chemotaxis protein CheC n=1 Tax=Pectinatus sottacetonis TaxID=1002795 RepID=UPI0018C612A7